MSGLPDISASSVSTAGYEDGLGRRSVRFNREVGGMLECLHLRPQFRVFEEALRACAEAIAGLDDERFAVVRDFEKDAGGLRVISDLVTGHRLIDVLETRPADDGMVSGIDAAFGFLLQAMPALATLHANSMTHGAIAPGRIIVTPNSQVVLLDAIYGSALERLDLSHRALWMSFGIMAPPAAGAAPLDRYTDVGQVALCGLLLAAGRPLSASANAAALLPLVKEVTELAEIRAGAAFADGVNRFFTATLPAAGRRATTSSEHATAEIRRLVGYISEDESLNALAELVCYRPAPPKVAIGGVPASFDVETLDSPDAALYAEITPVRSADDLQVFTAPPAPDSLAQPIPAVVEPALPAFQLPPPPAFQAPPAPVFHEPPAPVVHPPAPVFEAPPAPLFQAPSAPVFQPAPVPPVWAAAAPPFQPVPQAAPGRIIVGPPLEPPAPTIPPARIPAPSAPAVLKIRQDHPPARTPIRLQEPERVSAPGGTARALSFLDRAAAQPEGGVPWKIVAAAVLVLLVGGVAGWDYLAGRPEAEPTIAAAPAAAPEPVVSTTTGGLTIDSQPSGATVSLDGKEVGVTPLTLEAVTAGRHQVTITSGAALIQRSIRIEAGKQATINVPVFSGWVAIFAPIRLDVAEGRRSLGSTESGRILLSPGRHVLTLSNAEFGYSEIQTVEISPGEERVLNLRPTGKVNLNASPWAEVWVDGTRAGETPLANLEVALGTREFVFKHPQYGERRLTATITTRGEALSIDFGRPPSFP